MEEEQEESDPKKTAVFMLIVVFGIISCALLIYYLDDVGYVQEANPCNLMTLQNGACHNGCHAQIDSNDIVDSAFNNVSYDELYDMFLICIDGCDKRYNISSICCKTDGEFTVNITFRDK